jgi:hypothetical protein
VPPEPPTCARADKYHVELLGTSEKCAASRRLEMAGLIRTRHALREQGTGHGFVCQISAAYSLIVRSLENHPDDATLRMLARRSSWGRS